MVSIHSEGCILQKRITIEYISTTLNLITALSGPQCCQQNLVLFCNHLSVVSKWPCYPFQRELEDIGWKLPQAITTLSNICIQPFPGCPLKTEKRPSIKKLLVLWLPNSHHSHY